MNKKLGVNEKNRERLDSLSRLGKNLFSVIEAAEILNLPVAETRVFLAYSARRGWLSRVKRGFYCSIPLGTINPHEYRENPFIVANKLYNPCYIGGWSAAEHWEFTDQIFNSIVVFTERSFRKKRASIQGTEYLLTFIKSCKKIHIKSVWVTNEKIQISNPSQTIVDILNDPLVGGGIRHCVEIVQNYFNSEHRNTTELLECIKEVKNKTIFKRLGYILESLNIEVDDFINTCKNNISAGYSALDPTIKNKGTFNRKWNLRINADIKK